MVARTTLDSNRVGLGYVEEVTYGVTPATPVIQLIDPNSYADTGANVNSVSREPLNPGRQNQKGNVVGVDAAVGFEIDFTYQGQQDLLQGFMVSTWENKVVSGVVSAVTGSEYSLAVNLAVPLVVDSLVFAEGFTTANNNGFKVVAGVPAVGNIAVAGLTIEASPPTDATVQVVGFRGAPGDIDAAASIAGNAGRLDSTVLDFTTLGLQEGEWIYIGGTATDNKFIAAENNGFARIAFGGISANELELDKVPGSSWTVETTTTEDIDLYFGDVLKNQKATALQVVRSYTFERTFVTTAYEVIPGSVPNEMAIALDTEAKMVANLDFISKDGNVTSTEIAGITRLPIVEADLLNTSSDVARLRIATDSGLTTFVTSAAININNGVTANKQVGALSALDVSLDNFAVSGDLEVYFTDELLSQAVRNNTSATFDLALRANQSVFLFDMPLITFSDGRPNVEKGSPVTVPIPFEAFEHPDFGYTLMLQRFKYAPTT
ncbi:MAG: hypothetical protein COA47_10450 [Robiginitomaculum sp.]|nr:MAG: hypothetical protein COA47_10450 [Robiginitomaculum sp.]